MVTLLYKKGQEIIDQERPNVIRKPFVHQKDLWLINHYDNFAKATSLKRNANRERNVPESIIHQKAKTIDFAWLSLNKKFDKSIKFNNEK